MNIYDFFNSPDVAEHCQSIGHQFNPIEMAVMIDKSESRSLAEKHAAYRTIIAQYPDMEVKHRRGEHIKSFHEALEKGMAHEECAQDRFLLPEPGVEYQATVYYKDDPDSVEFERFLSYEESLADVLDHLDDKDEDPPAWPGKRPVFDDMSIIKKYLGSDDWIEAKITRSGDINRLYHTAIVPIKPDWAEYLLDRYIDVPVPFKRGDLVEMDNAGWMGSAYVLSADILCDRRRLFIADTSDMTASIFYELNGLIQCECTHFYPDLRYCRRELEGEKRILKYVSLYMQDKICLCSLLKLQTYLPMEKLCRRIKKSYNLSNDLDQVGDSLSRDGEAQ